MPEAKRSRDLIEHILRYCQQIETAHADFDHSRVRFQESSTYQNAVCMCILQIGELVRRLPDAFRAEHAAIPWHKIRGMRNFVAHEYGSIDLDVVWFVANVSIAELKKFCEDYLSAGPART